MEMALKRPREDEEEEGEIVDKKKKTNEEAIIDVVEDIMNNLTEDQKAEIRKKHEKTLTRMFWNSYVTTQKDKGKERSEIVSEVDLDVVRKIVGGDDDDSDTDN